MKTTKKKILFIVLGIIAVATIAFVILLVSRRNNFEYEGWLNCQPILPEDAAELCKRAEAAGYPYIAY